jgi:hypothetical protein
VILIAHIITVKSEPMPEIAEKYVAYPDIGSTMLRLKDRYDTVFLFRTFTGVLHDAHQGAIHGDA